MMNFKSIWQEAARQLHILADDDATLQPNSGITLVGLKLAINRVLIEDVGQILMDKYPHDFEETYYPMPTYRTSFTIDASSSGTTLVATSSSFSNTDEGFQIQNGTSFDYVKILTYINPTQVTLTTTIPTAWVAGQICYVLGNEFTLKGDALNKFKEVRKWEVKYRSTDNYIKCILQERNDLPPIDSTLFSTLAPIVYPTAVLENGIQTRALGLLPFPLDFRGAIRATGIRKIDPMVSDSDVPPLDVAGISEPLINGACAWGCKILRDYQSVPLYEEMDPRTNIMYPKGTRKVIQNYKPTTKMAPKTVRLGSYYSNILHRTV